MECLVTPDISRLRFAKSKKLLSLLRLLAASRRRTIDTETGCQDIRAMFLRSRVKTSLALLLDLQPLSRRKDRSNRASTAIMRRDIILWLREYTLIRCSSTFSELTIRSLEPPKQLEDQFRCRSSRPKRLPTRSVRSNLKLIRKSSLEKTGGIKMHSRDHQTSSGAAEQILTDMLTERDSF